MSSPRAATSVATSSSVRPLRSRSTTRVRCSWSMPPCSASARSPRAVSVSVTASTSSRVRQNTMAAVRPLGLQHPAQRGGGVRARHQVGGLADLRRLALGTSSRRIRTVTGSRRYFWASVSMRRGMVAENSTTCRVSGVASSRVSMSSTKPMSSISSASSSTTVSSSSRRSAPRFIRSMARPGVATTMSTPLCSAFHCGPTGAPP